MLVNTIKKIVNIPKGETLGRAAVTNIRGQVRDKIFQGNLNTKMNKMEIVAS